jgi:hypothetical protein
MPSAAQTSAAGLLPNVFPQVATAVKTAICHSSPTLRPNERATL